MSTGFRLWEEPNGPHWRVRNARGEPLPVPNVLKVTTTDFPNGLTNALFPKFQELAPSEFYEIDHNVQGYPTRIKWAWGSEIIFMSHDQDPMKFESGTFHAVHHDEPPPRHVRVACLRGLMRHAGLEYFTLTPIVGGYILNDVVKKANGKDVEIFNASIDENRRSQGGVLDDDAVDRYVDSLTEEEKLARAHGLFPGQFGRCIPAYIDEAPQVIPKETLEPEDWYSVCILDPHERKPDCLLWVAIHKTKPRIVIYNEEMSYETMGSARKTAAAARRKEAADGLTPTVRLIDPRMASKPLKSAEMTYREEYARHGFFAIPAPGLTVAEGFKRINDWFSHQDGEEPYLQIMEHCHRTRSELSSLTWAMKGTNYMRNDKPDGPDDHVSCLRYLCLWAPQIAQHAADAPEEHDRYEGILDEVYNGPGGGAHTGY